MTEALRRLTPSHVVRIAKRACAIQGLPEDDYGKLPKDRRDSFERGTAAVIEALDGLGFRFEVPPGW